QPNAPYGGAAAEPTHPFWVVVAARGGDREMEMEMMVDMMLVGDEGDVDGWMVVMMTDLWCGNGVRWRTSAWWPDPVGGVGLLREEG
nr:hypothetical protein [Tanacetum cinerariifolium]